jgi:hypothetical protein
VRTLLVTLEMILPAIRLSTSKDITHHIFRLEVYGSFVPAHIRREAGAKGTALKLTGVFLLVYGAEVFTTQVNMWSIDSYCRVAYRRAFLLMEILVQPYA